ncbi:MAG: hypothetical protein ACSW73_04865, partial [Spirochaetales bacterium]
MTEIYRFSAGEDLNKVFRDNARKKTVFIPSGRYCTGPVKVPSGSHIIFEEGAVLDFTTDFGAYPPVQTRWEGVDCWAMHPCFFIDHAEDVVIEGHGRLE